MDTAEARPIGTMKTSAEKLIATRCAAAGTGPSCPISKAAPTNRLPSTAIATAIGSPTLSKAAIVFAFLVVLAGVWIFQSRPAVAFSQGDSILIADFEAADYGDWQVEGEAFGTAPAKGTLDGQMQVTGFEGKGHQFVQ